MPSRTAPNFTIEKLTDLSRVLLTGQGFAGLVHALQQGRSGSVDGAWGSSAALAAAALGLGVPSTLVIVLAHPRDIDGWADDLVSFGGQRPLIFPAWDHLPTEKSAINDIAGQRFRFLRQLVDGQPPRYILTTIQALLQPVPSPQQWAEQRRQLGPGHKIDPEELSAWLVDRGYERNDKVELPGDFSRRGGILDIFSPDAEQPFRLEFFGDEIDSVRHFSLETQRSLGALPLAEVMAVTPTGQSSSVERPLRPGEKKSRQAARRSTAESDVAGTNLHGHFCDYLSSGTWSVLVEPEELLEQGNHYLERVTDARGLFSVPGVISQLCKFPSITISALPSASVEITCHLRIESVERFSASVTQVRDELDSIASADCVMIASHNEAEGKRLGEVLAGSRLAQSGRLRIVTGKVRAGFRIVAQAFSLGASEDANGFASEPHPPLDTGIVVLGDHELFHRQESRQVLPRRRIESRAIDSFLDLAEGELVVHVSHGIARYLGMQVLEKHGQTEEHLVLEFRDGVRVYVPASKIDLVQKYIGGSKTEPELSKLGGTGWQRKKDKVEAAVLDLASEMVELQALREAQPGIPYPDDTEWQAEFEGAFPYQETPDQLTTIAEIKKDMQNPRPMDRLICGDVGYGKTELAVRAAFKAIDNGKQAAVLVPTTVLAEQHYRTFSQRLAEYPFVVEVISRFRTPGEQKRIVERLGQGGVDVIIGTHRLVSADVQFKDLGLVIIDEEQRFGVEHKEKLKKLRQTVDVLTLTATPIPRTLHLALLGIRNISNLETPPPDRLPIETRIVRFDPQLIRHAILRELNREGQIYFVHNRVHNIRAVADQIQQIVPEARLSVAHGQMPEHELEQAMVRFVRGDSDILVATTIIESGLDIPNVNTIFINQAENYGLADLHQLRGRVGRYKHRAYAYLLLDSERAVSPTAGRRLKAIEEFSELGAGFKIALRDLEIRGAGNILGNQQSGHIAAVGYELYCQLLENSVRRLKNQPLRVPLEVTLDLPWRSFLPRNYVQGQRLRIEIYRRLARIRRPDRLEDFRQEIRDRFGPLPEVVEWLLRLAELRLLATRWQVSSIHLEAEHTTGPTDVVLGFRSLRQIKRLAMRSGGRLRVVDASSAYFRLEPGELEPSALYACLKDLLRLAVHTL